MDWKEIVKNFKLADFQINISELFRGQQIGFVNKIENYNITMPKEMLEEIINLKITDAMQSYVECTPTDGQNVLEWSAEA